MDSTRRLGAAVGVLLGLVLPACLDHSLKPVEYKTEGVGSGALPLSLNKDVDILFVIDNSGSMAEEQATLARNFERFIAKLEADDVQANYRIGITTTDNGALYGCDGSGPESGHFQLTSCLERANQFVFDGEDHFDEACATICDLPGLETTETTTLLDATPKPRPWLEHIDSANNLPDGITAADAFECFGPQGIGGCGFESTLEAMHLAFVRANQDDDPSYGFMRPGALLAVVFVTDEEDCSLRKSADFVDAWTPDGNHVFWSEQNLDMGPTSEVCWNAGVHCEGGPGTYSDCSPIDLAVDGSPTDAEHSVLYDVQTYIDFLQDIEDRKRELDPDAEVIVAALAGVPHGYSAGEADIVYSDGSDPGFLGDMGIGAGCSSAAGEAVPPVRLRAFAEAFALSSDAQHRNIYSICDDDYSPALEQIANIIGQQLAPACMPRCVADSEPLSPELDPDCTLTERYTDAGGSAHADVVPKCDTDGAGAAVIPDGAVLCYRTLTGDEMDMQCIEDGWNLQFEVVRAPGAERTFGSTVEASCIVSQQEEIDCPNL